MLHDKVQKFLIPGKAPVIDMAVMQVLNPAIAAPDRTRLVRGGKEYFDLLLKLIDRATESIHLQTYIYDDDETGQLVADALIAAHKRGVKVYLMADGYASLQVCMSGCFNHSSRANIFILAGASIIRFL
jgi:phosphatidylserine/phosphatidylglycerophosphate/cardiolipin synthase-like enzyme